MQLRSYQVGAVNELRSKMAKGARRLVLVVPTGGGKTVIASSMIEASVGRGNRVLFIAHRKELIDQAVEKLARFGVSSGVLMGQDKRRDDYQRVQVASIQTLSRRRDRLPPAQLIIYDEVHHAMSNSARQVLDAYPDAFVIGLTATPWRSDKLGLADVFCDSVLAATPAELMRLGFLVQYEAFAYDSPDLHAVRVTAGDYNQRDLGIACNTQVLVGSVVREYLEHVNGRRAILFPVDIAHSQALVAEFSAHGVRAAHVDCYTPKLERERILTGLSDGSVTVVSSVGVLTEGFDCPAAEVCILARPTKALGLHLQMIGRVLRPSPETGKSRALIHCHAGNLLRHGFPDDEREYALGPTPKRTRELHSCPFCYVVFGSTRPDGTCPKCGELIKDPRSQGLDPRCESERKIVVEGRRVSMDQIRMMREKREKLGIRNDLTDEQLVRTSHASVEEKAAEYMRLCAVAEARGFKPGFVAHQFRATFGVWPARQVLELAERTAPARKPFLPLPPKKQEVA